MFLWRISSGKCIKQAEVAFILNKVFILYVNKSNIQESKYLMEILCSGKDKKSKGHISRYTSGNEGKDKKDWWVYLRFVPMM